MDDIARVRKDSEAREAEKARQKRAKRMDWLKQQLQPPTYEYEREAYTEELGAGSSGLWVFEDPSFKAWWDPEGSDHRTLYINAVPGAGKSMLVTTILNSILDKALRSPSGCWKPILYFYCRHNQENKRTFRGILRSMLHQLLSQDAALCDTAYEELQAFDAVKLRSTAWLSAYLKEILPMYSKSYLLIDGLDECTDLEARKALDWCLSLEKGGTDHAVRVLFSGQRSVELFEKLSGYPSIALEFSPHLRDLKRYCLSRRDEFCEKFPFSQAEATAVVNKVENEAAGMFLFAKIVLDNLLSINSLDQLHEELQDGTFPTGLDKAYQRVVSRIYDEVKPHVKADVGKILEWVASAKRLLYWREIQAVFCIDLDKQEAFYKERRLLASCKELCGSLIDLRQPPDAPESEMLVQLVHESARGFLSRRKLIQPELQNAHITLYCLRYLSTDPFKPNLSDAELRINVESGYYALHDYAVAMWYEHLDRLVSDLGPAEAVRNAQKRERSDISCLRIACEKALASFFGYTEGYQDSIL
ncbi:unnamed protein product [Parascedosporium putredinis]|uniref:NACHT domain-containing protein n=1 Tax=Parascedosporium putredinis TaxID=1442378 RepID=A0A9P1H9Q9_9PEZI|nr:unnamed protein product [Parascedosporium putredinis]CAI8003831.1 unnamed protein product [Parascedosporium putredinis]